LVVGSTPVIIDYGLSEEKLPIGVDHARLVGTIIRDVVGPSMSTKALASVLMAKLDDDECPAGGDTREARAIDLLDIFWTAAVASLGAESRHFPFHLYGFAWIGLKWDATAGERSSAFVLACATATALLGAPVQIERRALPMDAAGCSTDKNEDSFLLLRTPSWRGERGLSPSLLLRPENQIVPFHSARTSLVQEILDWAQDESGYAVALRLQIGEGGSGKTRLMLEVCNKLKDAGWVSGFMPSGEGAWLAGRLSNCIACSKHVFAVLDYAETRSRGLVPIIDAASKAPDGHKVRLVLIARSAGDWWKGLPDNAPPATEALLRGLATTGPYEMPPLSLEEAERAHVYEEALDAFSKALNLEIKEPRPLMPELRRPHFSQVLYVHMTALAALLDDRTVQEATELLDTTIRHERDYWQKGTHDAEIGAEYNDAIALGVAMMTLAGGSAKAQDAKHLLEQTPRLNRCPPLLRDKVFDLLRKMYPSGEGISALQPDLIGERLVARQLEHDSELLDASLGPRAARHVAEHALTVLGRMSSHDPTQTHWLKRGLRDYLSIRARSAIAVAVESGDPVGHVLADVISEKGPRAWGIVSQIQSEIPEYTISLRELGLVAAQVVVEHLEKKGRPKSDKDIERRALAYSRLSQRYRSMSMAREALDAAQRAEALGRTLADKKPTTTNIGNLANYVVDRGNGLKRLGNYDGALRCYEEALEATEPIVRSGNITGLMNKAVFLNNQANILNVLGLPEEAFVKETEAIKIQRELATNFTDSLKLASFQGGHARTLCNMGQFEQALVCADESVTLTEQLADTNLDAVLDDLAAVYSTYARCMDGAGNVEEAFKYCSKSIVISRKMAHARPRLFQADLSAYLLQRAWFQYERAKLEDSLHDAQEALDVLEANPVPGEELYEDTLSRARISCASCLNRLGIDAKHAAMLAEVGLARFRQEAAKHPNANNLYLASALEVYSRCVVAVGKSAEAQSGIREATELFTPYFNQYPKAHVPLLRLIRSTWCNLMDKPFPLDM
jgi:tetratricopeptide (TPR) repeat protein